MKHTASRKQHWLRLSQTAIASAAFALLAACGGGSDNNNNASSTPAGGVKLQVVSFGDSLSDAGTYSPVIQGSFGGGRFTTNPGEVWTQKVAEYYGDTLKPAYLGGFGQPLVATGGYGYAQGGSDVVNAQGKGWAPNNMAATTVPIVTQVANYLGAHSSFNPNQLVLVNGGANDIFQFAENTANLTALGTALQTQYPLLVQAGKLPNTQAGQVAFIVGYLQQLSNPQVAQAAAQLAAQVKTIVGAGATHVVVSTVPDIGNTPLGVASNAKTPGSAALLSGIAAAYNYLFVQNLTALGLVGTGKVIVVDAFAWQDQQLPNYKALGFTVSNTDTACNLSAMQANATAYARANPAATNGLTPEQYGSQFASSLFCSPQTYTVAGADQTYMFADTVHPSTHMHALFAQYVQQQIAATGLGK
ncbi:MULTISPECIES: SGNH/GDSL hydrolase family protein [Paraburkholderia]|jgi:phospholipase/lecithinase/hemolysin|uniref:Phospholipase/lecithinase/hemolysin n=1 Tax=Paraburkholderia caledonica TaxID=134536 RepID=A0ABU1L1N6_9BURK|nr:MULTISPECIES: SGNH/GDSL hydrolase family protein [Paraburkholderia]OWJ58416.1 acylhydrolase [Burkholderia sp. Bk]MDR6377132.1 phospholipase/lecithinase/hemolysin [Paraburkholderia caledonica]MDR7004841.1 phospholipase/lecithinase/hemolysin [Paraburkholderia strydomiana]TCF98681.1 acylhydrolase [Paraburkholderia strydomiana]CAH2896100.1 MAG: Phospholipase/lecithinase/hemolysin [uncultured Paraburkholderia sp.]